MDPAAVYIDPRVAIGRGTVLLPGTMWLEAGPERSAQHYAITLLDALCTALAKR